MDKQRFTANMDTLRPMLIFIEKFCRENRVESTIINKIILAAEEALVNVINYSYPDREGMVEIGCSTTTSRPGIRIEIKDDGTPFNPIPSYVKQKTRRPIEEQELGGYGIFIYVGIMDKVEYERMSDGNLLALIKYF